MYQNKTFPSHHTPLQSFHHFFHLLFRQARITTLQPPNQRNRQLGCTNLLFYELIDDPEGAKNGEAIVLGFFAEVAIPTEQGALALNGKKKNRFVGEAFEVAAGSEAEDIEHLLAAEFDDFDPFGCQAALQCGFLIGVVDFIHHKACCEDVVIQLHEVLQRTRFDEVDEDVGVGDDEVLHASCSNLSRNSPKFISARWAA